MMTEQELQEEQQIFAEAVSSTFARFAQVATPANLRAIQASVDLLIRKLDRLEAAEAELAKTPPLKLVPAADDADESGAA